MMIDNSKNGRKAIISIWLFFVVSLIVLVLLTLLFLGLSVLPETWSGDLSEGFYGTLSMDLIEPIIGRVGFLAVAILVGFWTFTFLIGLLFWGRWFSCFIKNRKAGKISAFHALATSLIPGFGILFHAFYLKSALHYFEKECLANEMSISKFLPRRFFLWQNAACVLLCFFIFSTFKYWLAVFILEFLFLLAIWYYGLLVSTLVKEEQKLYQIQSSSGSGQ